MMDVPLLQALVDDLHTHAPDCPNGSVINLAARVVELLESGDADFSRRSGVECDSGVQALRRALLLTGKWGGDGQ